MGGEQVATILKKYPVDGEALLPILQDIQDALHYLPERHLKATAQYLNIPLEKVFSVATFYNAFSLKPKGKFVIQVCTGTACHIKGANGLLEQLTAILGIREGETTEDGLFTVEGVRCLGCCSLAPVMSVNGKVYGNLVAGDVPVIIESYRHGNICEKY